MELDLSIVTFNTYGGGATLGALIALIELEEQSFGSALEVIEFDVFFKSSLPFSQQRAHKSLKQSYDDFHKERCTALPIRRFMRKKRKLKIAVLADFATAEEASGFGEPKLEWQSAALDLLISEVEACRKKLKPTDDFRFRDFLDWLQQQHDNLPKTKDEAEALDRRWRELVDTKREQLDEWQLLGLDWDEYHESAREVVSDPRLWSMGHEFAPNGNDSGADLIYMFRSEKSRWVRGGGKAFYRNLAQGWGFDPKAPPSDTIDYEMKREAIIGLAFAFLKLFAYCPAWLADEAIHTIDDYKSYLAVHHLDWEHREECLEYQDSMLTCLNSCPRN